MVKLAVTDHRRRILRAMAVAVAVGTLTYESSAVAAPTGVAADVPSTTTTSVPSTTTTTTTPALTLPTGPPAPPSFAVDLTRVYHEASAVSPPPGVSTTRTSSGPSFEDNLAKLSPDDLTQVYDWNPAGWDQTITAVDAYAQAVPAAVLTPSGVSRPSSPATNPAKRAASARAASSALAAPAPPVEFEPNVCPDIGFVVDGGALQQVYALEVAHSTVVTTAESIETSAVALASLAEEAITPIEQHAFAAKATAFEIAATVTNVLADGLVLPIDVIEFIIHRAVDSCEYDNNAAQVPIVDANVVATQTNVNSIFGLAQQNVQQERVLDQLLDRRTQTIVNQLNGAQASLDQDLRHSIEQALSGGAAAAVVSYQLPSTLGGYLDATPIGVQAIVTSTIALMQTAKQPVAPAAARNLVLANNALASGQFRAAFALYQTTYQQLVR